jgi:hypothetical protein
MKKEQKMPHRIYDIRLSGNSLNAQYARKISRIKKHPLSSQNNKKEKYAILAS